MGAKASSRLYVNISREREERKHAIILFCVLETSALALGIKDEVLTALLSGRHHVNCSSAYVPNSVKATLFLYVIN
jgi:hypothetical protein